MIVIFGRFLVFASPPNRVKVACGLVAEEDLMTIYIPDDNFYVTDLIDAIRAAIWRGLYAGEATRLKGNPHELAEREIQAFRDSNGTNQITATARATLVQSTFELVREPRPNISEHEWSSLIGPVTKEIEELQKHIMYAEVSWKSYTPSIYNLPDFEDTLFEQMRWSGNEEGESEEPYRGEGLVSGEPIIEYSGEIRACADGRTLTNLDMRVACTVDFHPGDYDDYELEISKRDEFELAKKQLEDCLYSRGYFPLFMAFGGDQHSASAVLYSQRGIKPARKKPKQKNRVKEDVPTTAVPNDLIRDLWNELWFYEQTAAEESFELIVNAAGKIADVFGDRILVHMAPDPRKVAAARAKKAAEAAAAESTDKNSK